MAGRASVAYQAQPKVAARAQGQVKVLKRFCSSQFSESNALEHCAHRHRHFGTQTRRDCPRTVTTEWSLEVGIPLNPLNPPQTLSIPLRRPDLYHIAQRLAGSGAGEMTAEQHIDRILEERKQRKEAKKARKEAKRLKKRRAANSD